MGTIAAPLLGGFAFAAVGLVVQGRQDLRWPDQTLALLVFAFLSFVTSVQATFHARRHYVSPDEFLAWLSLASTDIRRAELEREYVKGLESYSHWAAVARRTYSLAIIVLFAATAVLLVPSGGGLATWRVVGVSIAALGTVGECAWVAYGEINPRRRRKHVRYDTAASASEVRVPTLKPPSR